MTFVENIKNSKEPLMSIQISNIQPDPSQNWERSPNYTSQAPSPSSPGKPYPWKLSFFTPFYPHDNFYLPLLPHPLITIIAKSNMAPESYDINCPEDDKTTEKTKSQPTNRVETITYAAALKIIDRCNNHTR
jgi:hypothetical protein